jgi:ribulose-bisphosphate carboxylase large chain
VSSRFHATYLIETPLDPARVADVLAGEQSSGTFVRVAAGPQDVTNLRPT